MLPVSCYRFSSVAVIRTWNRYKCQRITVNRAQQTLYFDRLLEPPKLTRELWSVDCPFPRISWRFIPKPGNQCRDRWSFATFHFLHSNVRPTLYSFTLARLYSSYYYYIWRFHLLFSSELQRSKSIGKEQQISNRLVMIFYPGIYE